MYLLVGLGNPGPEYAGHRHNIGFMVLDEVASRSRCDGWKGKFGGLVAGCEVAGSKVVLLKPMQYMNLSGKATQQTAAFYRIEPKDIVVIHDELDLDFGTVRVKVGGGLAGHNGLRSVAQELGTQDFIRIRCGIGRPMGNGASWVLNDFGKQERTEAEIMVKEAAEAVEEVVRRGPLLAMNKVNAREKPE